MNEHEFLDAFGTNMLLLRKKNGLSLRDLAEKVNMTATALSNYEKGIREPSLSSACAIAEALGTTVDALCEIEGDTQKQNKTYADIISAICNIVKTTKCKLENGAKEYIEENGYIQELCTSFSFSDAMLHSFLSDLEKIANLYSSHTIDEELFDAWVEKKIRIYKDFPYPPAQKALPKSEEDDLPF